MILDRFPLDAIIRERLNIDSGVVKAKSKHIAVKHHHTHDEYRKGAIHVYHIFSDANVAAIYETVACTET